MAHGAAGVFTRRRQALRFHLSPFKNPDQTVKAKDLKQFLFGVLLNASMRWLIVTFTRRFEAAPA